MFVTGKFDLDSWDSVQGQSPGSPWTDWTLSMDAVIIIF